MKRRVRRRPPGTLDRERIVAAALAEIDRHGLAAFSLRNLARSLRVYPTAVTWYVSSRDEILAEVGALVLDGTVPARVAPTWQADLRQLFHAFRAALRKHPNATPLIGTELVVNRAADLAFVERVLATLGRAGYRGRPLVHAYNAVVAAMVGFVTQELAPLPAGSIGEWRRGVKRRIAEAPAASYPTLAANRGRLANRAFILRWQNGSEMPLDDSYRAFVELVIAGLGR